MHRLYILLGIGLTAITLTNSAAQGLAGQNANTQLSPASSTKSAASITELNRGIDIEPSSLDPHQTVTTSEAAVLQDLYDGLVVRNADGIITPAIAKSWDVSPDGLVYTFHLRDDARWSNGDRITAGDFQFSLRRLLNPKTAARYANLLYVIKYAEDVATGKRPLTDLPVQALDEQTLQITLKSPIPYFLELLTHHTTFPLHQKTVEAYGDKFTTSGLMVTSGAYKLVSYKPSDKIELIKNPYYYNEVNVPIDRVNWIAFEDRASCMRRFEAKEVQICSDIPVEQLNYIKQNFANELHVVPELATYYLSIKGKTPDSKLKDPRVRQAISLALDREFIADQIWNGLMAPAYSMVPPFVDNYVKGGIQLGYADDDMLDREDRARALLAEAGIQPNSLSVELRYNTSQNHKNTMAAIANMLSNIGINASLNEAEGTTYFNYMHEGGAFDIARSGWFADYSDAYAFLFIFTGKSSLNSSRWNNAEYEALLAKAEITIDLRERAKILAKAERILLDELPIIPLMFYSSKKLVSSTINGWKDGTTSSNATRYLSFSH